MTKPDVQVVLGPEWRELADRARSEGFGRQAAAATGRTLKAMAAAVVRHVDAGAAKHDRGPYRRPRAVKLRGGTAATYRVVTGAGTNLLVAGVRPHRIRSDRPMPLHGGGVEGFAQAVAHPGYGGDPFVARGVDASQGEIHRLGADLLDDLRRLLTGASGRV